MCAWRKLTFSMKSMQFSMFSIIESQTVVITEDYGTPPDRAPFFGRIRHLMNDFDL